jgi:hypothetical protein
LNTELRGVHTIVGKATLTPALRKQLLDGLAKLPALYEGLEQTYESRFHDAIIRAARLMLKNLADADEESPDAQRVAEGIVTRLQAMHERLGIPNLNLKMPLPPKVVRKKTKAK